MGLVSAFSDVWNSFTANFLGDPIAHIVNVDGTPMVNDCIDIHGNPFGVSSGSSTMDSHMSFDNPESWSSGGGFDGF